MWQDLFKKMITSSEEREMTGGQAMAAILVRAAKTDQDYTLAEQELINRLLSKQMNIKLEAASELRTVGESLEKDINDNVQLTRILKRDIPYEDRIDLVEQLWLVILSDDVRTDEENRLMRILTYLLGVSDVESAKARSRATKLEF